MSTCKASADCSQIQCTADKRLIVYALGGPCYKVYIGWVVCIRKEVLKEGRMEGRKEGRKEL